jgi:hypothetical protein
MQKIFRERVYAKESSAEERHDSGWTGLPIQPSVGGRERWGGEVKRGDETSGSEGKEEEEEEEEEEQVTIKKEVQIQTVLPACSFRTYEYGGHDSSGYGAARFEFAPMSARLATWSFRLHLHGTSGWGLSSVGRCRCRQCRSPDGRWWEQILNLECCSCRASATLLPSAFPLVRASSSTRTVSESRPVPNRATLP